MKFERGDMVSYSETPEQLEYVLDVSDTAYHVLFLYGLQDSMYFSPDVFEPTTTLITSIFREDL